MGLQLGAIELPGTRRTITQPLGGTVWLFLRLTLLGLVLPPLLGLLNGGRPDLYGFGSGNVCATVTINGLAESGSQPVAQLRSGMSSAPGNVWLCANHPTLAQRFLVTLTQLPMALLWLTVLILLWRLVSQVRRTGPFDATVTRRLRFLAWFVLAATLAANALQSYAAAAFTATGYPRPLPGLVGLDQIPVPIGQDTINGVLGTSWTPLLLVVCGLLSLARIVRVGGQLHDDLVGTV
ncbi:MAG: hypothetical protein JO016_03705 [Actinobacteria bacterium]|nr:hypothetical protein [Actinomycetota bacterium]